MTYTSPSAQSWSHWSFYGLFLLLAFSAWTQATSVAYCSPDVVNAWAYTSSIYMSNGNCITNCKDYVFAILQGDDCWCSNYAPANQVSISECNVGCPGYPSDTCGNPDQKLWAYLNIGGTPSGTIGGSSSSSASASASATSRSVSTSAPTTLATVSGTSSNGRSRSGSSAASSSSSSSNVLYFSILTSSVSSQSSVASSIPPSSSSSISATASLTPSGSSASPPAPASPSTLSSQSPSTTSQEPTQVYTSIISVTGRVSTITITPTPAQTSDSALGAGNGVTANSTSGGGLTGGKVAGIVVGVAIAIGLIIGSVVFFWLRKRHRRTLDAVSEGASYKSSSHTSKNAVGAIPSRQVSQLSSAGLLTKPGRTYTGGPSPAEFDNRSAGGTMLSSDRSSTHMTVDQRLNPWAIYSNEDSRASNVSLQDNQDYSRQLRVANPDSRDV